MPPKTYEKKQGCVYCNEQKVMIKNGDILVMIDGKDLEVHQENIISWTEINFCPHCGKQLHD